MKISTCTKRPVLLPCSLRDFEYQIDPYVGCEHFCYYCYVLDQAETDWSDEVLVHEDVVGRLKDDLKGLKPQTIYMGYHSDPYQPCEAELLQTRGILKLLLKMGFSASILTKSDLVLRDMDILGEMADSNVSVSVAFSDDNVRQRFEASTISTERRIDTLRKLREAGANTTAMVCPVIPHLTDVLPLVEELSSVSDAVWVYGLSVQDESQVFWSNVQDILGRYYRDLKGEIESVVLTPDNPYWSDLRKGLNDMKENRGLDLRIHV